jgi:hypothetical protein
MEALLIKLKLVDYLKTELYLQKGEFIERFSQHVDDEKIGGLYDAFDAFSSSKNEYKGHVGLDSFKIKRRRKFFDMNINMATASGTFRQHDDILVIDTKINGFSKMMIPFYIFVVLIYFGFIVSMILVDSSQMPFLIMIPFISIHAFLMLGMPYFLMRKSVKRMKHDLERELYYMTKEPANR